MVSTDIDNTNSSATIEYTITLSGTTADTDGWVELSDEWEISEERLLGLPLFIIGPKKYVDPEEKIEKWKLKMAGFFDKKYHKSSVKKITSKAYYSQKIKAC